MKALIIYDSQFGNTETVAQVIGDAIGCEAVRQASHIEEKDLLGLELLVVGSPTQGGRPTKAIQEVLAKVPAGALKHTRVAAFDTRIPAAGSGFFLRTLLGVIGYAAPKIEAKLRSKGGTAATRAQGFYVIDKDGPLAEGEQQKAAEWAKALAPVPVAAS